MLGKYVFAWARATEKPQNFICTFNATREKLLFDFFCSLLSCAKKFLSSPARKVRECIAQTWVENLAWCWFRARSTLVASEALKNAEIPHQQNFLMQNDFHARFLLQTNFNSSTFLLVSLLCKLMHVSPPTSSRTPQCCKLRLGSSAVAFNFQLNHEFSLFVCTTCKPKVECAFFCCRLLDSNNIHIPFAWVDCKLN